MPPAPASALARAGVGPCPEGSARTSSSHCRPSARCPRCCQNRHSAPAASWARSDQAGLDGPPQGHADVGVLLVASVQPLALVLGGQVGLGLHRQVEVVVPVAPQDRVEIAAGPKPLPPKLPDGLQHEEPGPGVGGLGPADQRLVDQRGQPVQHDQGRGRPGGTPPPPSPASSPRRTPTAGRTAVVRPPPAGRSSRRWCRGGSVGGPAGSGHPR